MAASTSMWEYHTSRLVMAANWCMPERYSPSRASSTLVRSLVENPLSRPAMAKLAASRLTSHSHGPGHVSSKSLMPNTSRRSGEREDTEVHQVGVAADLGGDPRPGRAGQVGGHDERRAPVEGERRHQHPAVADRHQLGHPGHGLLFQQRHRVRPVRARGEAGMARPGHLAARRLAPRHPLLDRQVRDHLAVHVAHAGGNRLRFVLVIGQAHRFHDASMRLRAGCRIVLIV